MARQKKFHIKKILQSNHIVWVFCGGQEKKNGQFFLSGNLPSKTNKKNIDTDSQQKDTQTTAQTFKK